MRLMQKLEAEAAASDSIFRRTLAQEDLARLARLRELAREQPSQAAFFRHGLFIGWTKDDLRTGELKAQLEPLMEAVYAYEHATAPEACEAAVEAAWAAFHLHRMKVLVHCL